VHPHPQAQEKPSSLTRLSSQDPQAVRRRPAPCRPPARSTRSSARSSSSRSKSSATKRSSKSGTRRFVTSRTTKRTAETFASLVKLAVSRGNDAVRAYDEHQEHIEKLIKRVNEHHPLFKELQRAKEAQSSRDNSTAHRAHTKELFEWYRDKQEAKDLQYHQPPSNTQDPAAAPAAAADLSGLEASTAGSDGNGSGNPAPVGHQCHPTKKLSELMGKVDKIIFDDKDPGKALGVFKKAAERFGDHGKGKGCNGRVWYICACCDNCRANPTDAFVTSYKDERRERKGTVFFDYCNATELDSDASYYLLRHLNHQAHHGVRVERPPYLLA
jgi:hypothetical protein